MKRDKRTDVSSWTTKLSKLPGNNIFCEIPISFISDPLIMQWIQEYDDKIHFKHALNLLITSDSTNHEVNKDINDMAMRLYTLLHSKYVLSINGLNEIKTKHLNGVYGKCPRVLCNENYLLPIGLHDTPNTSFLKCFCSKCRDIYHPDSNYITATNVDGAAFGTTLPHLLLNTLPQLSPQRNSQIFVPKIFGFRISANATEILKNEGKVD